MTGHALLMPEEGPTRLTRVAGRALCLISYLLAATVAYGDIANPSATISVVPKEEVIVASTVVLAMATLGFAGVVTRRWRIEWAPASVLTFLLLARVAPVWLTLGTNPTRLSAAAMMTLGALCLCKRSLDLWIFSKKTRLAAYRAQERRRDTR